MLTVRSKYVACIGGFLVAVLTASGCHEAAPPNSPPASSPVTRNLGPPVKAPQDPFDGEVARFSFARPDSNEVSVGPYAVKFDELVVRGACRSLSGSITWKVLDNSTEAESAEDVKIVDQGEMACDGKTHEAKADVSTHRDVGILGVTGASEGEDAGESAWLTLANE